MIVQIIDDYKCLNIKRMLAEGGGGGQAEAGWVETLSSHIPPTEKRDGVIL